MIDVEENRRVRKWSLRELTGRVLWTIAHPFFSLSPRPLWGWRRMILRLFGATVGRSANIYPSVQITIPWNIDIGDYSAIGDRVILYALGRIKIAERVTISQGAHLCAGTHDYRDPTMPLVKASIFIGSDVWVCADAFIGPGAKIGACAIVGARAVVTKEVAASVIVAGNPAHKIARRDM